MPQLRKSGTSAEACEKISRWLRKEICVCTGLKAKKHMCVTDHHDMTLAVKPFPNGKFFTFPKEKSLQMTILNLMNIAESSPKG